MDSDNIIIAQTKKWISNVVVGCNFCPFAGSELRKESIHYYLEKNADMNTVLQQFIKECMRMDEERKIETCMIIFPGSFQQFEEYLDLVSFAEELLEKEGYEGIYQVASFHPQYRFAGSPISDAANYTNRSPYPMLQILREESVENALKNYPDPAQIPTRNVNFAREKGVDYMRAMRDSCMATANRNDEK